MLHIADSPAAQHLLILILCAFDVAIVWNIKYSEFGENNVVHRKWWDPIIYKCHPNCEQHSKRHAQNTFTEIIFFTDFFFTKILDIIFIIRFHLCLYVVYFLQKNLILNAIDQSKNSQHKININLNSIISESEYRIYRNKNAMKTSFELITKLSTLINGVVS